MTLNALLGIAGNALAAQSYALDIVGNNTANVNTPGYVEEQVNLQDLPDGNGLFGGVNAVGTIRTVSQYTQAQVYGANGQASGASAEDSQLATVQSLFNDLSGTGLNSTLSALFSSFGTLATNPTDRTSRSAVVAAAQAFAGSVSTTASSLSTQKQGIVSQAQGVVQEINMYTAKIAKLNTQIAEARGTGRDTADLRDSEDAAVTSLSQLVNISTFTDGTGNLVVRGAGTTLVDTNTSNPLSVQATAGGGFSLGVGPAGATSDLTSQLTGGTLGGLLNATEDITTISTTLDQLASDVGTSINTQLAAGFDSHGASGAALFDVQPSPGTALGLTVNSAVANDHTLLGASSSATDPSDGSNAAALAGLRDSPIATGGTETAGSAYASIVGSVGQLKANSAQSVGTTTAVQTQAKSLLDSQSGVSLDQEMVNMQTYQSAYQAASRLLSTVTTLLNDLMASVH